MDASGQPAGSFDTNAIVISMSGIAVDATGAIYVAGDTDSPESLGTQRRGQVYGLQCSAVQSAVSRLKAATSFL
jgi:hypothetical protein